MATVPIDAIDTVLGMTGLALERAGYADAGTRVKASLVAECPDCGVTISGAGLLSEQRQLARQWAHEGVVLYRGPDALAWENLDENKCVRPGCSATTYRVTWTDSAIRLIFNSVLSRFEPVGPHGHVLIDGACKFCYLTADIVQMYDVPCRAPRHLFIGGACAIRPFFAPDTDTLPMHPHRLLATSLSDEPLWGRLYLHQIGDKGAAMIVGEFTPSPEPGRATGRTAFTATLE